MDCKIVQKRLSDYRMGMLSGQEHALIDQHLSNCANCRAALKDEESVSSFLRQTGDLAPPDTSVASELMQKLKQKDRETRNWTGRHSPFIRGAVIGLIGVLFALVGVLIIRYSRDNSAYFPTYGPVGFTLVGDPDEDEGELWKSLPGMPAGGRSVHNIQIPVKQPDPDAPDSNGRVIHTFELGTDRDTTDEMPVRDKEGK